MTYAEKKQKLRYSRYFIHILLLSLTWLERNQRLTRKFFWDCFVIFGNSTISNSVEKAFVIVNFWWWYIDVLIYFQKIPYLHSLEKYFKNQTRLSFIIWMYWSIHKKTNTYFSRWYCWVHSSKSFISKDFKNREICCC